MRFLAKHRNYGAGTVIAEKFVLALDGQRDQSRESVNVTFTDAALTDDERAYAAQALAPHRGLYMEEDRVTLEDPKTRISAYDTEKHGFTDQVREQVEQYLLNHPFCGRDFIVAPAVVVAKPWNSYDETHHFKIPTLAVELGCVTEALAYEQATKNRPGVVAALTDKIGVAASEPAVDEEVVLA